MTDNFRVLVNSGKYVKDEIFFRPEFPYILSDISLVASPGVRKELLIPEDPVSGASFLLSFPPDKSKLRDSMMYRITDSGQCYTTLEEHPDFHKMTSELRDVYDQREHVKQEIEIDVPKRGGERWDSETDPTYDGKKTVKLLLLRPVNGTSVAAEFEYILKKYDAITMLEESGPRLLGNDVFYTFEVKDHIMCWA